MLLKRVALFLIGVILLILVIFLGVKSVENTTFVLWFGLASALIAPVGLSIISASFNVGKNNLLKKLLKVPAIDELIQKAETQEEKIRLLEEERQQISTIVKYETIKHATLERRKHLESEAERILNDLNLVEKEIERLKLEEKENRMSNKIIDELYRKLENSNSSSASTELIILSLFDALPIRIPFITSFALLIYNSLKKRTKSRKT